MKKITLIALALVASFSTYAQSVWTLDKSHAKLAFGVSHLLVSETEGDFTNFDVRIQSSKDDFIDAIVEVTALTNSVNTENADRDKHIQSPDFFDAAKYPTLIFKSKSFKKVDGKNYKLVGDLTFHGVTKSVEFDVVFNGTAVHPYTKKTIAGFKLTGKIKRSDFGIGTATPAAVVGDDVTITSNLEVVKN